MNHFELRDFLQSAAQSFHIILDNHTDLIEYEPIASFLEEWIVNDDELTAAIKYYNDNVVYYNKLIRCFPSNLIRLFFHLKSKSFYKEETEEIYEILKEK